jgi:hypothetical protein
VRLHNALADGEPQAGPREFAPGIIVNARELLEQQRQLLPGYAPTAVTHVHGDLHRVAFHGDGDGLNERGIRRRVIQQIRKDLAYTSLVGKDAWHAGGHRQLDFVAAAGAGEGGPGLFDNLQQVCCRFGVHRKGARLDAGYVEEVVHQLTQAV